MALHGLFDPSRWKHAGSTVVQGSKLASKIRELRKLG